MRGVRKINGSSFLFLNLEIIARNPKLELRNIDENFSINSS